jgi:uncharacterized protein (DUF488 family)
MTVYTIGHSNHSLGWLLDLLSNHEIEVVADVRSHPSSRFAPHFNRAELAAALKANLNRYLFLGAELGGRPEGERFYDDDGHVLYSRVAETDSFASGIKRVEHEASRSRVALMCSEEDPIDCHRRLLVSRVLMERGAEILHIRADGSVNREDELRALERARTAQTSLFQEPMEAEPWRSTQSVLQRRAPRSFSSF